MRFLCGLMLATSTAGCAVWQPPRDPPVEALTHVQQEEIDRGRGDYSAVDGLIFRRLPRRIEKIEVTGTPMGGWDDLVDSQFSGKYRRDAKTTFAMKGRSLAPFEQFESVSELVAYIKETSPDEEVKAAYKKHTDKSLGASDNNEARLEVERRNVRVFGYIRAVKWVAKEDQDFHVMLCEGETGDGQPCFTTEASGVPKNGVRAKDFRRARRELIETMREFARDTDEASEFTPSAVRDKWAFFNPGISVEISGSLFLDAIHPPGVVGPRPGAKNKLDHRTPTSWEVHPIYSVRPVKD